MAEQKELIEALTAVGCVDTDIWQLAHEGVSVSAAVLDLKARYPTVFKKPFDVMTASEPEYQAHRKGFLRDFNRTQQRRRDEREMAKLSARYGARA
ncbi:hypothetical protein [Lichenicoccus sp.]|uniref:hypothetical protein n=1 Tax=Lichenicoccus sp. TaxID=2781899 RepID=UPI003D0A404C